MRVLPRAGAKSIVGWLDDGKALTVLAVSSDSEGSKYLLWSELQEVPVLFPACDFESLDCRISKRWTAKINENGYVYLAPDRWQKYGFWEDYHNGDSCAEECFMEEMREIFLE